MQALRGAPTREQVRFLNGLGHCGVNASVVIGERHLAAAKEVLAAFDFVFILADAGNAAELAGFLGVQRLNGTNISNSMFSTNFQGGEERGRRGRAYRKKKVAAPQIDHYRVRLSTQRRPPC